MISANIPYLLGGEDDLNGCISASPESDLSLLRSLDWANAWWALLPSGLSSLGGAPTTAPKVRPLPGNLWSSEWQLLETEIFMLDQLVLQAWRPLMLRRWRTWSSIRNRWPGPSLTTRALRTSSGAVPVRGVSRLGIIVCNPLHRLVKVWLPPLGGATKRYKC